MQHERDARNEQRAVGLLNDLSDWPNVFVMFARGGAFRSVPVPQRKTYEQLYGLNEELDEVRELRGFDDLWKLLPAEPRAVRAIYRFRDAFQSLTLARSLLERVGDDGRAHSRFFCGGKGSRAERFTDWLPVLKGDHFRVTLSHPLQSLVFWLAGEKSPLLDVRELAKDWFGLRLPSHEQVTLATAIFDAYLLGHKGWLAWDFIGKATRRLPEERLLEMRREELRGRLRRIEVLHNELGVYFWKPVTDHREFERKKYRQFFDQTVERLQDITSAVAALAIEETAPGTVVARFQDRLLCEGQAKPDVTEKVNERLADVFPGATFSLEVQ